MSDPGAGWLAVLHPGQGAQRPGMIDALPATVAVRKVLDEAADVLGGLDGLDAAPTGGSGTPHNADAGSTTNVQLSLLICGVAGARALAADTGITAGVTAGHSVGAFAAAVGAGVLTFAEALTAVRLRGQEMARACADGRWGMAAAVGLDRRRAEDLVASTGAPPEELWVAGINAADQVLLAGTADALEDARGHAERAGAHRFDVLDVTVASHGPRQHGTAEALRRHFADVPRRRQVAAYVGNTGARLVTDDAAKVLDDLAESAARAVRWYDIARVLPEYGVEVAVQTPPGHVLTRLLPRGIRALSLGDDGAAAVASRVTRAATRRGSAR